MFLADMRSTTLDLRCSALGVILVDCLLLGGFTTYPCFLYLYIVKLFLDSMGFEVIRVDFGG